VVGTPFDGRYAQPLLLRAIGAIVVLAGIAFLVGRWGASVRGRWLLVGAAGFPVVFVVGLTAFAEIIGQSTYVIMISRYTAVAAPFMVIAIAIVAVRVSRVAALGCLQRWQCRFLWES
jgi:hypothetical protein